MLLIYKKHGTENPKGKQDRQLKKDLNEKEAKIYDQKHHNAQSIFDLKHCQPKKMQECSKSFSKKNGSTFC